MAEGKGGVFGVVHTFPSVMVQNFWIAILAWSTCFVVTIVVSMVTQPRPDGELEGLVYSLTKIPHDTAAKWHQRLAPLVVVTVILLIALNIWFA
jgi:SSS family solute:Na+ symporter